MIGRHETLFQIYVLAKLSLLTGELERANTSKRTRAAHVRTASQAHELFPLVADNHEDYVPGGSDPPI